MEKSLDGSKKGAVKSGEKPRGSFSQYKRVSGKKFSDQREAGTLKGGTGGF